MKHVWDSQLSERETSLIGMIVIHWAAIEHEIFTQTLSTFGQPNEASAPLPKAMNNMKFTDVFALWKERVVCCAKDQRAVVLSEQIKVIEHLKEFRDAIVHGHWDWSATDVTKITTMRVKKKTVISTTFDVQALEDFAFSLSEVNYNIRFPGGLEDVASQQNSDGGYISRRAFAMLFAEQKDPDELRK